jgi:hypothetical protein
VNLHCRSGGQVGVAIADRWHHPAAHGEQISIADRLRPYI